MVVHLMLAVSSVIHCPRTRIVVPDGDHVNALDRATAKRAGARCGELYPSSPCAKVLTRTNAMDYRVICGPAKTRQD